MHKRLQSSSSDHRAPRLVAVFPKASLHAEARFTFLPENSLEPLSKGSDKYRSLDQIAAEMYVICTLLGEVTDNETFPA